MLLQELIPEIFDLSKIPDILFHYTTIQGFYGIVNNQSIWATDYRYLNDIEEAVNLYKNFPESITTISNNIKDAVRILYGDPKFMVSSFSEARDNIAMWGRYSQDEGLNIGFSNEIITNLVSREDVFQKPWIGKCIYNKDVKTAIVNRIYNEYQALDDIKWFLQALLKTAPFIKNESFEPEQEWRVVFDYKPQMIKGNGLSKYRYFNGKIIPHMNLSRKRGASSKRNSEQFNFEIFEKMVLSPRLSRDPRAEIMLKEFLRSKGIMEGEIIKSQSTLI